MRTGRVFFAAAALTVSIVAACLTVNVYFYPSEEVDKTAKKIIEDIRSGGPMPEMVDRAIELMDDPNFPTVRFSKALTYFETY